MIYYFAPYDTRGLGHAYNRHCALVPNDLDWVCFQDIDVMFYSTQRMGEQLEAAIKDYHPQFSVFTAVTNRSSLGCRQQQLDKVRDERDLLKLKERADYQTEHFKGKVENMHSPFSGHFFLFPKWLWKAFPFAEIGASPAAPGHNILGIDTDWEYRLRKAGHKFGLMYGLMATHYYRMDDKQEHVGHLPGGNEWMHKENRRRNGGGGPPWKFIKQFGVNDNIRFADGTNYRFPWVRLADGSGFCSSSEVTTSDKVLADNLREAAKTPSMGIVETAAV
jgi:hypothetical protein